MSITRRRFLRSTMAAMVTAICTGTLRAPYAFAANTNGYRAIVCIDLEGGNDGANMFIPTDVSRYATYTNTRGSLAQVRDTLIPVIDRTNLDTYGFHRAMPRIASLFTQQRVALLANVGALDGPLSKSQYLSRKGIPDNLFSHNSQQDQWQSLNPDQVRDGGTGWGGLSADALRGYNGAARYPSIVTVAGTARFCLGEHSTPASINPENASGVKGFSGERIEHIRKEALARLLDMDQKSPLMIASADHSQRMLDEISLYQASVQTLPPLTTSFPDSKIGRQLKAVADVIRARIHFGVNRQIFYVSLAGFDTHAHQEHRQLNLLAELDAAMSAFYDATVEMNTASDVLTFTMSDFGRTLKAANSGSDHAWGNHQLIMGGSVFGGKVYGTFPSLELGGPDDATDKGRLIPTTSNDQYAATIAAWLGVDNGSLHRIFPNLHRYTRSNLGFV